MIAVLTLSGLGLAVAAFVLPFTRLFTPPRAWVLLSAAVVCSLVGVNIR